MLADFLIEDDWSDVLHGVRMCRLPSTCLRDGLYNVPPHSGSAMRMEFFFCFSGTFLLMRRHNPPLRIGEQEIFFFSDQSDVRTVQITDSVSGFAVSVDLAVFHPDFEEFCRIFGHMELSDGRILRMMERHDGCFRVHSTAWSRSAFTMIHSLPLPEQGRYCMLKIVELLYLLNAHTALLEGSAEPSASLGCSVRTVHAIRTFMEEHLDDKLTIANLSRRFHLSATALKTGFRVLYGQPIHSWLQERRIQRAAEMLLGSDLTVLQIAQSVGYEGVSQFNLLFKRQYGVTPSQYRKMSVSV